eukprot:3906318-Pleurochrysis_carterae.AAC.3
MSADDAAQHMHRHLYPLEPLACAACRTSRQTRLLPLPTGPGRYKSSYPGRLIHADIGGPFLRSHTNSYQYEMVLVDDHTRFKWVHLLRHKSEASQAVRAFMISFTALLNRNRTEGTTSVVGTFHSDNAGEFLSSEFASFLSANGVNATTCPRMCINSTASPSGQSVASWT